MKITKEHVGKRVSASNWVPGGAVTITGVGADHFLAVNEHLIEDIYPIDGINYCFVEDPKPLGASALLRAPMSKRWWVSDTLYQSQEEAEAGYTDCKVVWPARIDPKTGMYILPED